MTHCNLPCIFKTSLLFFTPCSLKLSFKRRHICTQGQPPYILHFRRAKWDSHCGLCHPIDPPLWLCKWSLCTKFSLVLRALINNRSISGGWRDHRWLISKREERERVTERDKEKVSRIIYMSHISSVVWVSSPKSPVQLCTLYLPAVSSYISVIVHKPRPLGLKGWNTQGKEKEQM